MISSLVFGTEGAHHFFSIPVTFTKSDSPAFSFTSSSDSLPLRVLGFTAHAVLENRVFRFLSTGYLHTFVHEMGHALAGKILAGGHASIEIQSNKCTGMTSICHASFSFGESMVELAGPLADVIFSVGKIIAAAYLSHTSMPLAIWLAASGSAWIIGELFYATTAVIQGGGDIGNIANRSLIHFAVASSAMIGTIALGLLKAKALL